MRSKTESLNRIDISSANSEDFNTILEYIGSDIIQLFNIANANNINMEEALNIIINDSVFFQKKIHALETELTALQETINLQQTTGYNVLYKSFYEDDAIMPSGAESISQDTKYGILTLQYQNTNKLPLQRFAPEFLQKNIDIGFTLGSTTISTIDDPSLLHIIDGDDATFWIHTEEEDIATNSITFYITINLPKHLLPSLTFNAININPYPMYSLRLDEITYIDETTDTETLLPTFPQSGGTPVAMTDISETKFVFPTITARSITFKFTQTNSSQANNVKSFTVGLRGIDLETLNTVTESTSFLTKFDTPKDQQYFLRVSQPEILTLNDVSYTTSISHELLLDSQGNSIAQFGSDIPADVETIYIRTTLTKQGQMIPVLQGIKIEYTTKT